MSTTKAELALYRGRGHTALERFTHLLTTAVVSLRKGLWEYSGEVQRHNGFVLSLVPALGLSESETDTLFIYGATL